MNRNFAVFVESFDEYGNKKRIPYGYSGLFMLIGPDMLHKLILRALNIVMDIVSLKSAEVLKSNFVQNNYFYYEIPRYLGCSL